MTKPENQNSDWSSLEAVKLAVSVATPLAVIIFGWLINRRLRLMDQTQWQNRKIIEKRIELYDEIAPLMNLVYCFCSWVGYWKDITPDNMLKAKRELDKTINIYKHLLSADFFQKYDSFIHTSFHTWTGIGEDAKIRSEINGSNGDRRSDCNYKWDHKWDAYFVEGDFASLQDLEEKYNNAMSSLKSTIGLD